MKNLVDAHLERIPGDVFVRFQESIKDLVSKQHGVYALYKGDKLYYVGLARNLKSRIQQHLKDRHKNKWNMFSLYLIRHVEHLRELETLVIHISAPKGNTQSGRFAKSTNLEPKLKRLLHASVQSMFSDTTPVKPKKKHLRTATPHGEPKLKGFLPDGTILRVTFKGKPAEASVDASGRVILRGKVFNSPSVAAYAVTGRPTNGWTFWKYQDKEGEWVFLDALRKKG